MSEEAHKDVGLSVIEDGEYPFTYHYCRSVFDWRHDISKLAALCPPEDFIYRAPGLTALYVVKAEGAPFCKIGITDNPKWRLSGLQVGNWAPLSFHSLLWVWNDEARLLEGACLEAARHRRIEIRGEWVKLSPSSALLFVLDVARKLDVHASGAEGVLATNSDETSCRAHAMKTARRIAAQKRAVRLGY